METTTAKPFNRFEIPIKFGIITGLVLCILSTLIWAVFSDSYMAFFGGGFLAFVVPIVFYVITGLRQRKAMGGFISLREAFSAIFITILISVAISFVYNFIYGRFIDPDVYDRLTTTATEFAERMKMSEEQLDKMMKQMEEQREASQNIGKQLLSFLSSIVISSIFGFIIAAIVRKKRPVHTV